LKLLALDGRARKAAEPISHLDKAFGKISYEILVSEGEKRK
jgi:hypothetical protein